MRSSCRQVDIVMIYVRYVAEGPGMHMTAFKSLAARGDTQVL
jgi:hypothetical protein